MTAELGLVVVVAWSFVAYYPSAAAPSADHTDCRVSRQEKGSGCIGECCHGMEVDTYYFGWRQADGRAAGNLS